MGKSGLQIGCSRERATTTAAAAAGEDYHVVIGFAVNKDEDRS